MPARGLRTLNSPETTSSSQVSPGNGSHDVVVVGGGVIGLACAWRLAEAGLQVRLFERDTVGSGASNVAAGMLAPVGEATWGEERLLAMGLDSHHRWGTFAEELVAASGITDIGYLQLGALHVGMDRDEVEELERRFDLMRELDLAAEWVTPSRARDIEPGLGPSAGAGFFAAHEAAVDPRQLTAALAVAARNAGATITEHVEVAGVLTGADGRLTGVRSADGTEHSASIVLLAGGAWSAADWLPETVRPPVRPVKGEILTLKERLGEPVCSHIVVSERVYMVPRTDGRLVIGATVEERGFDSEVTAGGVLELLREGYRALPDIFEMELVETTAGFRPGSPDNMPLIGASESLPGLHFATGHYRNGILLTPFTADTVAAQITGGEVPEEAGPANPERFNTATTGKVES